MVEYGLSHNPSTCSKLLTTFSVAPLGSGYFIVSWETGSSNLLSKLFGTSGACQTTYFLGESANASPRARAKHASPPTSTHHVSIRTRSDLLRKKFRTRKTKKNRKKERNGDDTKGLTLRPRRRRTVCERRGTLSLVLLVEPLQMLEGVHSCTLHVRGRLWHPAWIGSGPTRSHKNPT